MKEFNLVTAKDKFKLNVTWFSSFILFFIAVGLTFLDPNKIIGEWFSELKPHFPEFVVYAVFGTIISTSGVIFLFCAVVGMNIWGALSLQPKIIKIRFFISSIILAFTCLVGISSGLNRNQWIYFDFLFVLQLLSYGTTYEKLKFPAATMFGLLLVFFFFGANSNVWLFYDFLIACFLLIAGFYIIAISKEISIES